jgi:hypothetical protein
VGSALQYGDGGKRARGASVGWTGAPPSPIRPPEGMWIKQMRSREKALSIEVRVGAQKSD